MSIRLSEKHGVNPSVEQCFVCLQDVGVVLFGARYLNGRDLKAPHRVCLPTSEPCDECKGYMKQGIILISVDESKTDDPKNPWRTGGWVVVKERVLDIFEDSVKEEVLKRRMAFVPDDAWDMIGLPRGEDSEAE